MRKFMQNLHCFLQILFYIASSLTVIAFIFRLFGIFADAKTVWRLAFVSVGFLLAYFFTYTLYRTIYKDHDYRTIPEHLDELEEEQE